MFRSLRTNDTLESSTTSDARVGRRGNRRTPLRVEALEGRQLLNVGGTQGLAIGQAPMSLAQVQMTNNPPLFPIHTPGTPYFVKAVSSTGQTPSIPLTSGATFTGTGTIPFQQPIYTTPLLPVYQAGTHYMLR
jgi:hypothetical protein